MPHSPHPKKGEGRTKEGDRMEEVKRVGGKKMEGSVKGTKRNGMKR